MDLPTRGALTGDARFLGLLAAAEGFVPNLQARSLANLLHGYARLGWLPGEEALEVVRARALELAEAGAFKPVDLASALWAFAKLQTQPGEELTRELLAQGLARLQDFKAQDVANTLWAVASLELPVGREAVGMLVGALRGRYADLDPQHFAHVFWALARLQHRAPGPVLTALLSASRQRMREFAPRELCALAWALQELEHNPGEPWLALAVAQQARAVAAGAGVGPSGGGSPVSLDGPSRELAVVVEAYERFTGRPAEEALGGGGDAAGVSGPDRRRRAQDLQRLLRDCPGAREVLKVCGERAEEFDCTNAATALFSLSNHLSRSRKGSSPESPEQAAARGAALLRGEAEGTSGQFRALLGAVGGLVGGMAPMALCNSALACGRLLQVLERAGASKEEGCEEARGLAGILGQCVAAFEADPPAYNTLDLLQLLKGVTLAAPWMAAEADPGRRAVGTMCSTLLDRFDQGGRAEQSGVVLVQTLQACARLGLNPSLESEGAAEPEGLCLWDRVGALVREEAPQLSPKPVAQVLAAIVFFEREHGLQPEPGLVGLLHERVLATAAHATPQTWDKSRWALRHLGVEFEGGQNPRTYAEEQEAQNAPDATATWTAPPAAVDEAPLEPRPLDVEVPAQWMPPPGEDDA